MRNRIKVTTKSCQLASTTILGQGNGELNRSITKFKERAQVLDCTKFRVEKLIAKLNK